AIICENESYFLAEATASNYLSLIWETDGSGYFNDPNALNPTYFPGTGETGYVELSLTAYGNTPCADAFSTMNLEIIAAPIAFAGTDAIICEDESYFLDDVIASNYSSLLWETSGSGYFDDPNALNPTYFPGTGETGYVELSLTAYGNSPCADAFSAMNLEIIAAPIAFAGEDATIMEGESYFIFDASASNYESLEWSTDGSGYFDDPYILNPTYFPDSGETGSIILSLSVDGFAPCATVYSSMNLEIIGGGYPLTVGYQFVSSRIIPYSPNMLDVLANNLENIDFIRNSAGQMLRKIGPMWVNSIGDWITTEGYLFRMINPDLLSIYGTAIDPQTPIGLALGYQMISYLPEFPINTSSVFADVLSNLNFVRNSAGLMFRKIGPVWINGIGDMQPGEGYLVKMNADDLLIYPEAFDNLIVYKVPLPEHFKVIDGNPYDPVWTIYFEQGALNIGDEIAVYDGEILVGAGIISSENILENSIPVFQNLYEIGNYPIFKIWSKNGQEEVPLTDYSYINPYGDAYMEDIFPQEDGEYSMLNFSITGISNNNNNYSSITIYPNPSNGIFNISIERLSGDLQCKVIYLTGNEYRNFEFTGITGFTVKQLDLKDLPAGVYFISFTARNLSKIEKIVIQ
ncbi:MAG: T9SS type A sorting domain-containing protein, partial [Bacteroidales bacterium]|nr:T9SS type A sorting domain-containing protein [Bacteroidales bacterium]